MTEIAEPRSLLRVAGVRKRYGGAHALRGASLEIAQGEVHGLVGENGSGKSTLLKILSGQVRPDAGSVSLRDADLRLGDPVGALRAGIATVTQETTLVPGLSVAENILLGRRVVRRALGIDWRATHRRAAELLTRLELDIDPRAPVARLRPDEQQMVEIARAISMDARLLILDEPTSSLTDDEVEALFRVVRQLKAHDVSTIFVSHRLHETLDLTDRVTALRDGETVGGGATAELDEDALIELMVGAALDALPPHAARPVVHERPRLRVRDFGVAGSVHDATLDVGPGEIVGLAGLVGAGRSELLSAIFGLAPLVTGSVELDGAPIAPRRPAEAMRAGIAYVPADRKQLGLVLSMSMRENLLMAQTSRMMRLRRPARTAEAAAERRVIEDFQVAGGRNGAPIGTLSGGNQQKVVLAKWLSTQPRVLLLDEPTRGVDVGAKAEIYRLLEDARATGVGILVSSSETPELLLLCDRILVMYRGRIAASLTRAESNEARIAHFATGRT